jgi:mono/diheme cytochrome c family protein
VQIKTACLPPEKVVLSGVRRLVAALHTIRLIYAQASPLTTFFKIDRMTYRSGLPLIFLFSLLIIFLAQTACTARPEEKKTRVPAGSASSVEAVAKDHTAAREAATKNPSAASLHTEPIMTELAHSAYEKSCAACHGPDGHGITNVGSDLRIAPQRSAEEWEKYLHDPQSVSPGTKMPAPRGLSDEDYREVALWLADLTQHNQPPQKK